MIQPESRRSTIQQLHMGEGKSSVIVPLVAAELSDGENLVRVVVLKPLADQMFHMLVLRLSGLAQRRIYYMPFSRKMKIGSTEADTIQDMFKECMRTRGVLIVQPEHMLSWKLMAVDRLLHSTPASGSLASVLRGSQIWLSQHTRDVLDESDAILQVKYQLVYTVGSQQLVDNHPNRWLTIQQVFSLARCHIPVICRRFPDDIVLEKTRDGGFPRIRSLKGAAEDMLVRLVAEDTLDGHLLTCPQLAFLSESHRSSAFTFITCPDIPSRQQEGIRLLREHYGEHHTAWRTLLLLRGLFVHRILPYVLGRRRYRVDYGLDLTRSMMAVPYHAKDMPSLRAEFGHPDVCIALTCLSYHYGGLTVEQVGQCFEFLFKLDHRKQEYETWTRNILDIPEVLRDLDGVNVEDPNQRTFQLHDVFHQCDAVIDFFLSNVVFPKSVRANCNLASLLLIVHRHAREFPSQLATSGWDIAEPKSRITTGFSGKKLRVVTSELVLIYSDRYKR